MMMLVEEDDVQQSKEEEEGEEGKYCLCAEQAVKLSVEMGACVTDDVAY